MLRRAEAREEARRQWEASRQVDGQNDSRFPTQSSATVDCDWLWIRRHSHGPHQKLRGDASSRACTVRLTSATRVDDGQWHFIALTWAHATSNLTLYIDGVAEAARWIPLSDDRPGFVVKVGEATPHFPRPSYYFGKLSALWHWREVLEPLFVQRLAAPMNAPVEPPSPFAYVRSKDCTGERKLAACSAAQRKIHQSTMARSGMPSSSHFQLQQPLSQMAHGVIPLHVVYDDALAGQTNRAFPTRFSAVPQLPPSLALLHWTAIDQYWPKSQALTGTWEGMIFASNHAGESAKTTSHSATTSSYGTATPY